MVVFLTVKNGKIEVHADISAFDAPPALTSDSAKEVAQYLIDNKVNDFTCSSSMDFAKEYGWPNFDAMGDVHEAYEKIMLEACNSWK